MKRLLLAGALTLLGSIAFGQAGSLDLSFGTQGYVRTNFPVNASTSYASSAIQADGKIVTVGTTNGDVAIARLIQMAHLIIAFPGTG